jgi:hypothetical protein
MKYNSSEEEYEVNDYKSLASALLMPTPPGPG